MVDAELNVTEGINSTVQVCIEATLPPDGLNTTLTIPFYLFAGNPTIRKFLPFLTIFIIIFVFTTKKKEAVDFRLNYEYLNAKFSFTKCNAAIPALPVVLSCCAWLHD